MAVVRFPVRGAVTRCWCDRRRRSSSLFGGGFTANQRLPATAPPSVVGSGRGTFRVLSGGETWLMCAGPWWGGPRLFHRSKGRRRQWKIHGLQALCLWSPARRRSLRTWYVHKRALRSVVVEYVSVCMCRPADCERAPRYKLLIKKKKKKKKSRARTQTAANHTNEVQPTGI
jgi:hypothetical protein